MKGPEMSTSVDRDEFHDLSAALLGVVENFHSLSSCEIGAAINAAFDDYENEATGDRRRPYSVRGKN